jgi:hypothetical protein
VTPKEIDIALSELEERVDRLRALYESYFMGYEKLEPTVPRKEVDRRFAVLRKENIRNTAQRFKFNVVNQKFNTYAMYWGRICRQIEEGTYKRHLQRAKKRFGDAATPNGAQQRDKEREDASFDVDLTDFELDMGGGAGAGEGEDLDALLDAALDPTDVKDARVAAPDRPAEPQAPLGLAGPRTAPMAFQPYRPTTSGEFDAAAVGAKKLVRKKEGGLGPATPATPITPRMPSAVAVAPAAPPVPLPATSTGRFPAALPPAPASTPRLGDGPPSGRLPAALPPRAPTPGAPAPSTRLPAAPPPGGPRLSAATPRPPGAAPLSSQRLPAALPPGGPVSTPSVRMPAVVVPGPASSGRLPAAPPPGGPMRLPFRAAPAPPPAPSPSAESTAPSTDRSAGAPPHERKPQSTE